MSGVEVRDNPELSRYEAWLDGELAGRSEYYLSEGRITFTHTEVDDAFEGRGVGSALARGALDDVRRSGRRRVIPQCPFIKSWMDHHPAYQDLRKAPDDR